MSDTDWSNLPYWLPKKIMKTGLTVEQVAHRVGVSRTAIYEYLADESRPNEDTALKLSRVLGVKFEEVLAQYVPRKNGRPRGSKTTTGLSVRTRKR
jgi:transcriptional regulator with XRE-family HTH domain